MQAQDSDQFIWPLGKLQFEENYTAEKRSEMIAKLESLPGDLIKFTPNLNDENMKFSYKPGGWNCSQIIHHVADSHMNAFIRIKLALVEENPTIKPYNQDSFVTLADSKMAIDSSLKIIEGVHARMVVLLKAMKEEEFNRTVFHPEYQKTWSINQLLSIYSWHGHHHLAQMKVALEQKF